MDNATIRAWASKNNVDCPKNGNVPPAVVIAYMQAQQDTGKVKKDKVKKVKVKAQQDTGKASATPGDLASAYADIFSAGTIKMVLAQHPDRAAEILETGKAFLANGMKSRYAAIGKAIKGETPRIKAETPATPGDTGKASKGKGKAIKAAENGAETRYAVVLPTGVVIFVATETERDNLVKVVPGAIVGTVA